MCNLYKLNKSADEVASLFGDVAWSAGNVGSEVYPGYPGLVFDGQTVRSMTWGFPLVLKSKKTGQPLKPKPVNNARTDKLGSAFWRSSFACRRCLIPVSAFAEAEGPKGAMMRTWLSVPEKPVFSCAGIWRDSAEWGPCYSMVMTDPCEQSAEVHDRMPVIVASGDREQWLEGSEADALALCQPWPGELAIERTVEPWVRR